MKNREIVSRVQSSFKWLSADNWISTRAILAELRSSANLLIKRESDKRKLLQTDTLFTTIPCVEMISVPLAECCSYYSPCTIRRSKYKVPKIGEGIWGYLVQGVYSINGKVTFKYSDPNRYANSLSLGLPKKSLKFYWIQNDYLYISDEFIETVMFKPYLEGDINPELYKCSDDYEEMICQNPLDSDFKCPGYLIEGVVTMTMDKFNQTYKNSIADPTSNNLDEGK